MEDDDNFNPMNKFSIGNKRATVRSENHDLRDVHNDLLALSIILMVNPFVGRRLKLPFGVSEAFESSVKSVLTRYKIETTEEYVDARKKHDYYSPALAFSGGVDSTAALAVMPGNTIPIFMNRPIKKGSLYNPDAAHNSCKILLEIGYDVEVIECDLEYLRDPVGFPTDVANAVPCILLADKVGISSISFGTVLESAYGIGHEEFREYREGSHWTFFSTLFSGAGIIMSLPIAGISEVGTSIIAHESAIGIVAQSCIRGTWRNPCKNCWKCFRKGLLNVALKQERLNEEEIVSFFKSGEVKTKLSAYPISHENVISFSTHRLGSDLFNGNLMNLIDRVEDLGDLDFLEKWYSPSQNLIPEKWRLKCISEIIKYLNPMNKIEEESIQSWSMSEYLLSEKTIDRHQKMVEGWN